MEQQGHFLFAFQPDKENLVQLCASTHFFDDNFIDTFYEPLENSIENVDSFGKWDSCPLFFCSAIHLRILLLNLENGTDCAGMISFYTAPPISGFSCFIYYHLIIKGNLLKAFAINYRIWFTSSTVQLAPEAAPFLLTRCCVLLLLLLFLGLNVFLELMPVRNNFTITAWSHFSSEFLMAKMLPYLLMDQLVQVVCHLNSHI